MVSKNLYQLVTQLPNGERWKIWRKWQIEYELITRQDKKACQFIKMSQKLISKIFGKWLAFFVFPLKEKEINQNLYLI